MHNVDVKTISYEVRRSCIEANCVIRPDILNAMKKAKSIETGLANSILEELIQNSIIAQKEMMPICQDTGVTCVFVEMGDNVHITGGNLNDAINEGVRQAYKDGFLRKSIVEDPLFRKNTRDNTPAIIHTDIVKGTDLKIMIMPKGAGSENMSRIKNFSPNATTESIEDFIIETVITGGANACPPLIVGVGIGGNMDYAMVLAKKAFFREIGSKNKKPPYAELEKVLLDKINKTGLGPQGLGGKTTAFAVHIETHPCHIASLPVAVNLSCHVTRTRTINL
ncbi:MAG: fumarate hydratase [Elusimicrobia bacterium RIFOXYA2_FULL_39_19]|nr:MAG: fumarate hydratase [Elusimicrobia bacterium RIFOXYA2_FULL_39_19]